MTTIRAGARTLVAHHDIQNWVGRHNGLPALHRTPDSFGAGRARLSLRFHTQEAPTGSPSLDDGAAPCSWTAWLAELDRQQLAVLITDPDDPHYELVPRDEQVPRGRRH